jgi:anti-anti-sigma factor
VCQVDRSVFEQAEVPDAEGLSWVRAVADLDLLSASDGYAQLLTIWRNGPLDRRLVVELEAGCFVDVRGLRMLLEISRVVRNQGGSMVLLSSSRTVARVLAILDPAGELSFSRSMADAQLEARQCPLTSTP